MTRDQIKAIALARGFTERQQADGSMDLNGYVYAFAEAMYAEGQRAMQERVARLCDGSVLTIRDSDWGKGYDQAMKDASEGIRELEVKPS